MVTIPIGEIQITGSAKPGSAFPVAMPPWKICPPLVRESDGDLSCLVLVERHTFPRAFPTVTHYFNIIDFWHPFWHFFCHSFWNSIQPSFWHFWNSIQPSFWHSLQAFYLASIPTFYLTFFLTFYPAFYLASIDILYGIRAQACPTASGARRMARKDKAAVRRSRSSRKRKEGRKEGGVAR